MDPQSEMLLQHAASLRRSGRVEEAIAAYEQLLQREPDLPESWYNLGWLQRQARQYDRALASYGEALSRGVRDPEEIHVNRAVILSDHLARPQEAEAELHAALALKPDYLPALLNLGNLHEDRGDRGGADAAYRRALAAAPKSALALSRLAGVVEPASVAGEELVAHLRQAIASDASVGEQANLGFALGRLLDSRGEYQAAFEAYEAANRASRQSVGPAAGAYDRAAHERYVDRLIETFAEPATGNGGAPAVFIVGMFRSGSTLVEQLLAGHGGMQPAGELALVPDLAARIRGYPESVTSAEEAAVASWRKFYLDGVAPFVREGALLTDKRPDNFLHVGLIKTLFPSAKIVHTRRNRLDNLLSLYFLHLDPRMGYALDLSDAAHWYEQYERLMAHWKALYPDDIFDLDYDELVRSPEPVLGRLLGFLGLDWDGTLVDIEAGDRPVKTASVWQVREPIHSRSSGRWRNYSGQLKKLLGDSAD